MKHKLLTLLVILSSGTMISCQEDTLSQDYQHNNLNEKQEISISIQYKYLSLQANNA